MTRSVSILYAIREVGDALDEKLGPLVAAADLTLPQFSLLYLVVEDGPMRLGELARNRRCVKSNVSNLVRAMEAQGLVELHNDPDDRRARIVSASRRGLERFRAARRQTRRLERKLLSALGQDDGDELARLCLAAAWALDSQP